MLVTTKDAEGCRELAMIGVPPSLCREKGWGRSDLYYDESMEGLPVLAAIRMAVLSCELLTIPAADIKYLYSNCHHQSNYA